MAKINEYFLKAIFKEKEITIEEKSVTLAVSKMSQYVIPELLQDEEKDFDLYYSVSFKSLNNTDIDETQAFELKQHGWELDETEENIIRRI